MNALSYAFFWNIQSPKRVMIPPITAPQPGASAKKAYARMAAMNVVRYNMLDTSAVRLATET